MQINSVTNQPSFGMAQLTRRGETAAKRFISELPGFVDQTPYFKKNILRKMLKSRRNPVTPEAIKEFFTYGSTEFADKNARFIKKQILPIRGRHTIKKFLNTEYKIVQKADKSKAVLGENGTALADSIKELFDYNIANPCVSRKNGKRMLDLIKKFLKTEELSDRIAVVTEKLFSRK